jgi:hypothetical protein
MKEEMLTGIIHSRSKKIDLVCCSPTIPTSVKEAVFLNGPGNKLLRYLLNKELLE